MPYVTPEAAFKQALQLARKSDAVVIVTGLNADYESEGCE